jgi:Ni/Fe-hydrogenase 1 B-type cytochrome subunit
MADAVSTIPPGAEPLGPRFRRVYVWQLPIRIFHWVNAAAIVVLFWTGLYIAHPVLASNGEPYDHFVMARIRQIHFLAAYVFAINFMWRIYWFWFGNKYARSGFPYVWRWSWWKDLFNQAWDYLRLDFGTVHLGHNSLAGVAYTIFAIALGWAQMFTGFAMYGESNPGGFWDTLVGWVNPLLGGSFRTHMWHHLFAWIFLFFGIVHIYIVILDGRQYRNGLISSMIMGMKFQKVEEEDEVGE